MLLFCCLRRAGLCGVELLHVQMHHYTTVVKPFWRRRFTSLESFNRCFIASPEPCSAGIFGGIFENNAFYIHWAASLSRLMIQKHTIKRQCCFQDWWCHRSLKPSPVQNSGPCFFEVWFYTWSLKRRPKCSQTVPCDPFPALSHYCFTSNYSTIRFP